MGKKNVKNKRKKKVKEKEAFAPDSERLEIRIRDFDPELLNRINVEAAKQGRTIAKQAEQDLKRMYMPEIFDENYQDLKSVF